MRIARVLLAAASLLVLDGTLFAQANLLLSVDHAVFKGMGDGRSNLEIYYSIPRSRLTYEVRPGTGVLSGALVVGMKMGTNGRVVLEDVWKLDAQVVDSAELSSDQYIVDQRRFVVEPGTYGLTVVALDSHDPARRDSVSVEIAVPSWSGTAAVISDLQLGSAVSASSGDTTDKFAKGAYRVLPHPRRTYGPDFPVLYFYGEIYHAAAPQLSENYQIRTYLMTEKGQPVESVRARTVKKRRVSDAFAEVGHVNVGGLATGAYDLRFELLNEGGSAVASASKKFYVYSAASPGSTDTARGDLYVDQFSGMTEGELIESFDQVRSFARDDEVRTFDALQGQAPRQQFMKRFWESRDPNPATPQNEYYAQFRERLSYIREHYSWFMKPSWRTDRGRIYLGYGRPDEVERYPNEEDVRPYEIWHYSELQGGVIFVFGDRSDNGDYVLVHSTAQGHLNDPDWITRLRVAR